MGGPLNVVDATQNLLLKYLTLSKRNKRVNSIAIASCPFKKQSKEKKGLAKEKRADTTYMRATPTTMSIHSVARVHSRQ